MAEGSHIQNKVAETRRQAMAALDAMVKSEMRVAGLEKQLEKARQVADAKAKEATGFAQKALAATAVKHVICIQQDPRAILAPVTATSSSTPAASAKKESRPSFSSTAKDAKDAKDAQDAPKAPPKLKRRPWNPKGRQQ